MDIKNLLKTLAEKRPIFHNEADFQHALAWELRECYDCKIRLERRMDIDSNRRTYLDILAEVNGRKVAIELKYKMRAFEWSLQDEEFSLLNQGAQDIGRYDVLKDLQRLELMVKKGLVDEGFLIFLTNDSSYYSEPVLERATVDGQFRIHERREISGSLSWSENAGIGTMKMREDSITIKGKYMMSWDSYSQLDHTAQGIIKSLVVNVDLERLSSSDIHQQSKEPDVEMIVPSSNVIIQTSDEPLEIYQQIRSIDEIPLSQFGLRDKLLERFKADGYRVQMNRDFGKNKVDIWAEKGTEQVAVEVRFKTGLLNTIYNGKAVNLKNQAAQDISRYDFMKDLEKLENVILNRPDAKGYAVIITNDHTYWEKPSYFSTVDADFRIYQGREVHGHLSWKNASNGTTHTREETIEIKGKYMMDWKPFLTLGSGKYQRFKFLAVEVLSDLQST